MSAVPALLLFLTFTTTAAAPDPPPHPRGPRPSPLLVVRPARPLQQGLAVTALQREVPATHWRKGAVIGGLTGGLGLALFTGALCAQANVNCFGPITLVFLGGGTVGGILGALIGGQFPKDDG